MVIDPNNIGNATTANARGKLANAERAQSKAKDADAPTSPVVGDNVSLSAEAQSIGKLEAAVANSPSVDSDKVNAVRTALQSGQYRIDADAIADKMLDQGDLV